MMTETNERRLPVGIQSFEEIRKEGYLYVDKTDLIWQLANKGKKELFEGLKVMDLEKDWKHYPVIRLDME